MYPRRREHIRAKHQVVKARARQGRLGATFPIAFTSLLCSFSFREQVNPHDLEALRVHLEYFLEMTKIANVEGGLKLVQDFIVKMSERQAKEPSNRKLMESKMRLEKIRNFLSTPLEFDNQKGLDRVTEVRDAVTQLKMENRRKQQEQQQQQEMRRRQQELQALQQQRQQQMQQQQQERQEQERQEQEQEQMEFSVTGDVWI